MDNRPRGGRKTDNQMKAKRQRHQSGFKAKVGLEALAGVKTVAEIAREYQVPATQVSQWKRAIVDRLPEVFEHGASAQRPEFFADEDESEQDKGGGKKRGGRWLENFG